MFYDYVCSWNPWYSSYLYGESVCSWVLLPNSEFNIVISVAWNQPEWGYFIRQKLPHTTDYGCVYLRVCWLYVFMGTLLYLTGQQCPLPAPLSIPSSTFFICLLSFPPSISPFLLCFLFFIFYFFSPFLLRKFLVHRAHKFPLLLPLFYTLKNSKDLHGHAWNISS